MTALARVFGDVEKPLQAWLKADAGVAAVLGGAGGVRVYADGVPDKPTWPQIAPYVEIKRVGGAPDGGDVGIDIALLQVDAWGRTKASARTAVYAVINALMAIDGPTRLASAAGSNPGLLALGAAVQMGPLWSPDPTSDRPRWIVDVRLSVIAA